jgi:hypothetical protein
MGFKMEAVPGWHFRTIEDDQKHQGPTHRGHLATQGAVEPLVRESIQNSLDAALDGQVTRVIFTLGQAKAADARRYFQGLWPHLKAIDDELPHELPALDQDSRFLAVEDFGTRGLEGDPTLRKALHPDGSKNHFFRFWHGIGQHRASEFKRRGSWGVGKVVFSNASQIRTFFGVTRRAADNQVLLMGEAGLLIHLLPGTDQFYDWYGYYGVHPSGSERAGTLPVRDASTIEEFSKVFSIDRSTPGLSILVPYIRDEVRLNELARAVVEHYFLQVISGQLEVVLREGSAVVTISASMLEESIDKIKWKSKGSSSEPQVRALLDLARWQANLTEYERFNDIGSSDLYELSKDSIPKPSGGPHSLGAHRAVFS